MSQLYDPLNYGKGIFRRRIRVENQPGLVLGALEDNCHGFDLKVHHEAGVIKQVEGQAHRFPMPSCANANEVFAELEGVQLTQSRTEFARSSHPNKHCTHWHDLLSLAVAQACRDEPSRLYDIAVPDICDHRQTISLSLNADVVLELDIEDGFISGPSLYAGQSINFGLGKWAKENLDAEFQEYLFILQRARMVALSGANALGAWVGNERVPTIENRPDGICYSFHPDRRHKQTEIVGYRRDFTDTPEELLKFYP